MPARAPARRTRASPGGSRTRPRARSRHPKSGMDKRDASANRGGPGSPSPPRSGRGVRQRQGRSERERGENEVRGGPITAEESGSASWNAGSSARPSSASSVERQVKVASAHSRPRSAIHAARSGWRITSTTRAAISSAVSRSGARSWEWARVPAARPTSRPPERRSRAREPPVLHARRETGAAPRTRSRAK